MGEGSWWHCAEREGRGHRMQKSSSKELTLKFPQQGQVRENTKENWKPLPADGWGIGPN